MKNDDRKKFAILMAALAETFGNSEPSHEKIELYFNALSDLSIDQVNSAVFKLLNTRTITSTFPVPAEFREALGVTADVARVALYKAERAIERHGSYCAVVFDDPVIHMVISSMGGWAKFCCPSAYGDDQDWHWKQKEFVALYETYSKNPRGEVPKVLVGIGDTSYERSDGVRVLIAPKYVGDKQKAIEWTHRDRPEIEDNRQETGFSISGLLVKSM